MELTELKNKIITSFSGAQSELDDVLRTFEDDKAVFPFNEYERLICHLISLGGITHEKYIDIREQYISNNPYLWVFEISAPRTFGENFAQTHVKAKCSKLKNPSKEYDPDYVGQYDLWLDGIAIEVKASRVVDSDRDAPLYKKALSRNTKKRFLMNFQQLKPKCCDVFIWIAVFRDDIVLWIMNSSDVLKNPLYSKGQHRGNRENEGQLHITESNIQMLDEYEFKGDNMEEVIRRVASSRS